MKTIIIKGCNNSGKTTSLRNLYLDLVLKKKAKIIEYNESGYDKCDFVTVLQVNRKIIVINTLGDLIGAIRGALKKANQFGADIFITAWTDNLKQEIRKELPDAEIITNLVPINNELKKEWNKWNDYIMNKF